MSRPPSMKGVIPAFGVTCHGQYHSPLVLITGRQATDGYRSDAGFHFAHDDDTGKYKPHALILSRPKSRSATFGPRFQNTYGLTRFGKAGTPSAVLRGRRQTKDISISIPGPGAYEHDGCDECRIGTSLKGRWRELNGANAFPGPSDYTLPSFIGQASAYSLSPKLLYKASESSPGPIYHIFSELKKGMSLTFKPFPLMTNETNPGPAHYNTAIAATHTLRSSPATKFGTGLCTDCQLSTSPSTARTLGPGPGAFNIRDIRTCGPNSPSPVLTSRRKVKSKAEYGKLYNLSGMTRFGPTTKKHAILLSRHEPKDKSKNSQPYTQDSHSYLGFTNFARKKIGITLKSRLTEIDHSIQNSGPADYNLSSLVGSGPAFSLGPKYRGNFSPKTKRVRFRNVSTSECYLPMQKAHTEDVCEKTIHKSEQQESSLHPRDLPPLTTDILDAIPYLEQMCLNY